MADQTGASAISDENASLTMSASPPPEAVDAHQQEERRIRHRSRKTWSHQDYLDSLVVPPGDELARIAEVQRMREEQLKQHSRELQRRRHSFDVSSTAPMHATQAALHLATAPHRMESLARRLGLTKGLDENALSRAAITIQRHYRGYRMRREMEGLCLDANARWVQALRELQYRELTRPRARTQGTVGVIADDGSRRPQTSTSSAAATVVDTESTYSMGREPSAARRNWRKATTIALRAGHDEESDSALDSDVSGSTADTKLARQHRQEAKAARRREARTMGLQYFLEMVDPKHRYGANLRVYHEEWKRASTRDNFFYWLDRGDGRLVDMAACPRSRLEREQVRYLSREERQYYLVRIDRDGRLCWAKNGARIDTSERFRDSIHGIVPADDPTPAVPLASDAPDGRAASTLSSDSDPDAAQAEDTLSLDGHGHGPQLVDVAPAGTVRKIRHVSATALLDALLRKSVQANTWIFVADTSFRLYVGIKDSGTFQHSSFLQGSRISAAGLIRIRDGHLESLSPLSGHYRPPTANFRAFVQSLKEAGVDTGHVTFSKSYVVLLGLEAYTTTRQQGRKLLRRLGRHSQAGEATVAEGVADSANGNADRPAAAATKHRTDEKTDRHLLRRLSLGLRPASAKSTVEISQQ